MKNKRPTVLVLPHTGVRFSIKPILLPHVSTRLITLMLINLVTDEILYPVTETVDVKRVTIKNYDVMEATHSRGPVAYFLDVIDAMIFDVYEEDARNAFNAAKGIMFEDKAIQFGCVNIDQLEHAVVNFRWKLRDYFQQNGRLLFNTYDIDNSGCLYMKSFIYMILSEVANNNQMNSLCQHCMKKTKFEIQALFDYLDADGNGQVDAQGMFKTFKNFNTVFDLTSTMVNAFILLNDDTGKASVNREEFVNGIVLGITERELTNDINNGFSVVHQHLKDIRKKNAEHKRVP